MGPQPHSKSSGLCCLCGTPLDNQITKDHVPPKQFFPSSIRKKTSNLITVLTHLDCNKRFEKDEVYFVNTLGPLAIETAGGHALMDDILEQGKRPQGLKIVEMVRKEFTNTPGGIHLPPGCVAKQFDGTRVRNVAWKIVRELFFLEMKCFLPEDTPVTFEIFTKESPTPTYFDLINQQPTHGEYPSAFYFKYTQVHEIENSHWWALYFWEKLIIIVVFKYPSIHP
jgi:hypothetical protein